MVAEDSGKCCTTVRLGTLSTFPFLAQKKYHDQSQLIDLFGLKVLKREWWWEGMAEGGRSWATTDRIWSIHRKQKTAGESINPQMTPPVTYVLQQDSTAQRFHSLPNRATTGDHVLKYMSLWGTCLIQITTPDYWAALVGEADRNEITPLSNLIHFYKLRHVFSFSAWEWKWGWINLFKGGVHFSYCCLKK